MQANLAAQVRQMNPSMPSTQLPLSIEPSDLNSEERLTQIQQAQAQSDQLMLKLDSTLQIIFESLNRNVETYQESLEQGLNRMHSLGQQGEAMFAFLVNRLAQQLGREASSFLQASEWPQNQSLPGEQQTAEFTVADFLSQPPQAAATNSSTSFAPPIPFNLSEEVLDIADLEAEEALPDINQPDINQLVGLDHELQQLDLNALSADLEAAEPFELFTGDRPLPSKLKQSSEAVIAQSWQSNASDLDSALDLLNQLSAEMQTSLAENPTPAVPVAGSDRAELAHTAELITDPDSLYSDSLYNDDFYDNFSSSGEDSAQDSAQTLAQDLESFIPPTSIEAPADTPDLNQLTAEWFDGLADPATTAPAIQTTSKEALPPEATNTAHAVSQSLESRLLSSPAPAATHGANLAADLAAQTTSDTAVPNAAVSNAAVSDASGPDATVETIARLIDLIPSSEAAAVESFIEPPIDPSADSSLVTDTQSAADQLTAEEPLPVVEAASQPALDLGMTVEALESLGDMASPTSVDAVSAEETAIDPEKKN